MAEEREDSSERESVVALSRVPSADKMRPGSRKNSRVDLRISKSSYRILSTTGQQFFREPPVAVVTGKTLERVQTAKSKASEGEMRRTRVLMDKISGRQLAEGRDRAETLEESRVGEREKGRRE